jgi:hypothetical protein
MVDAWSSVAITIDFRLDSRCSASGARYGRELPLAAFLAFSESGKSWEGDEWRDHCRSYDSFPKSFASFHGRTRLPHWS